MVLKRSLVAGLAALLLLAPAADARSRFHRLGTGSVWTDGDRYAVLQLDGKPARVIDESTGVSTDVAETPAGCLVGGVADGDIFWECWGARPLLQEIQTGRTRPIPGWDAWVAWGQAYTSEWVGGFGPQAGGFGAHWIRGVLGCYHCGPTFSYLDWHSGARRDIADVATRVPDLDAPELEVPLCAPLRRPLVGDDVYGDRYYDPNSTYQRPWFLRSSGGRYVQLYRCGRRKPVRIARCGRPPCGPQLGGGYVVWSETALGIGTTVRAVRLADRRKVLLVGKLPTSGQLEHTRRTVYLNTVEGRVYAAPLRRR